MAQDPKAHADAYDLSKDTVADMEAEEGPATGAAHGQDRTNIEAHADREGHGPKTQAHIKDQISNRT